jgi:hypothetical protein
MRKLTQQLLQQMLAGLLDGANVQVGVMKRSSLYTVECVGPDGKVKWTEEIHNLVVDAGLNDSLDKHFKGSTYTAAWYVFITTASNTFAAADTMSSHAGWTESAVYSNATRPALTLGTVSGKSVDNSASKAVFNINAGGTVGGAGICTDSTKSGSTGTLYGGAAFSANRTVASGDTLNVTITLTAA